MGNPAEQRRRYRPPSRSSGVPIVSIVLIVVALAAGLKFLSERPNPATTPRAPAGAPAVPPDPFAGAQVPTPLRDAGASPAPAARERVPPSPVPRDAQPEPAPTPRKRLPTEPGSLRSAPPGEAPEFRRDAPEVPPEAQNAPPPAPTARSVIEFDDWDERVEAARRTGTTTLVRVRLIRELTAAHDVKFQGQILDLLPGPARFDNTRSVEVVVRRTSGAADTVTFTLPPVDEALVAEWRKWDRVEWIERPTVDNSGDVSFRHNVQRAADLNWVRNPGPELVPIVGATGTPSGFDTWLKSFAREAYANDERGAIDVWARGAARTWLFTARLSSVSRDHATGRLESDAYTDAMLPVTRRRYWPDGNVTVERLGERRVARWGVTRRDTLTMEYDDPQLADTLRAGDRVEVKILLTPGGATQAMSGTLPMRVIVRRKK